jgi:hypothetical protein
VSNNTAALVTINTSGTLVMKDGSAITGNTATVSGDGAGGVIISNASAQFFMDGGEISGNHCSGNGVAGGVFLTKGEFYMAGNASIIANTATDNNGEWGLSAGGVGIYNYDSPTYGNSGFFKTGGVIKNNEAKGDAWGRGDAILITNENWDPIYKRDNTVDDSFNITSDTSDYSGWTELVR